VRAARQTIASSRTAKKKRHKKSRSLDDRNMKPDWRTLRRSPFFHRYPDLITVSSSLPRCLPLTSAVFQPPSSSSSSSSSDSSPLSSRRSAMDDNGCCEVPLTCSPVKLGEAGRMSGGAAESESDSVPDTGAAAGDLNYLASNISGFHIYHSYVRTLSFLYAERTDNFRSTSCGDGGCATRDMKFGIKDDYSV
jgi:hypothetical protein